MSLNVCNIYGKLLQTNNISILKLKWMIRRENNRALRKSVARKVVANYLNPVNS